MNWNFSFTQKAMSKLILSGILFLTIGIYNISAEGEEAMAIETNNPIVVLETNAGTIEIKLFPDVAPKACENFIGLVEKGYYDGIAFHRVIKNFMIQGGDPTGTGSGGESIWGTDFEDEFNPSVVFDRPGLLAMANRGPATNSSQFFITTVPTPHLNNHHTIFGEVITGYETVQAIESTNVDASARPLTDQKIIRAYVKK